MARVPKYAFRVHVYVRIGTNIRMETHNYENLIGAMAYRVIALRKPLTTKVEIVAVLDESTPTHSV